MANVGAFGAARKEAERYINPNVVPDTFTFFGEEIRVADEIGLMPIMDFAEAADAGLDAGQMEGLAAIRRMLRDCIEPEDWPRFHATAVSNKADANLLLEVVQTVMEVVTGRPTDRDSDSPSGQSPSSTPSSTSLPVPVPSLVPATAAVG